MNYRKILISIYKKISTLYVLIFGWNKMQFFNDFIFSLSLNAKGYKNYGTFEKTGEKKFIKLIKDDLNLCIDIGANTGKYTDLLLSETNAKVISFEPLPNAYQELQKLKSKYKERLDTFNIAIGSQNSVLELYYGDEKSEKASLIPNLEKLSFIRNENKNKVFVDVKKLDFYEKLFDKKKIDFIKIDTEGFEYEVLKGAQNIIETHNPKFVQVEFNWHQLLKCQNIYSFSNLLKGYEVFRILPHGSKLAHIDPSRPENNIYHLSNYVFIRNDISKKYK